MTAGAPTITAEAQMPPCAASRLSAATCALSLVALTSCRGAEAHGDSTDASHSPTVVAPTDTIFYSCRGGFTGGGRETAITGRGRCSRGNTS